MSWHYRIRKKVYNGEPWYDIVEFYNLPKGEKAWTESGMSPGGSSRKEAIRNLQQMLVDARKYKTLIDKEKG